MGKMSFRAKLVLLTGIVFVSFILSLALQFYLLNGVKVGGRLYAEIGNDKDSLERIALLQSDLNLFRAQVAIIIDETNADKARQLRARLDRLRSSINAQLAGVLGSSQSVEQMVTLQDAQATWAEFLATVEDELLPAVRRGDRLRARELASGIQEQRYARYVEQIENTVTTLRLQIDALEKSTEERVRRTITVSATVAGAAFLLILTFAAMIVESVIGPLLKLSGAAEAFGRGEMNHEVPVTSDDEVGGLTQVFNLMIQKRRHIEAEREELIGQLQAALKKVKTLSGLLPVCASCKKVRDDKGYWSQIDAYITEHSEAEVSHSLCPDCAQRLYPEYWEKIKKKNGA